jgi:hypothetical protein
MTAASSEAISYSASVGTLGLNVAQSKSRIINDRMKVGYFIFLILVKKGMMSTDMLDPRSLTMTAAIDIESPFVGDIARI